MTDKTLFLKFINTLVIKEFLRRDIFSLVFNCFLMKPVHLVTLQVIIKFYHYYSYHYYYYYYYYYYYHHHHHYIYQFIILLLL